MLKIVNLKYKSLHKTIPMESFTTDWYIASTVKIRFSQPFGVAKRHVSPQAAVENFIISNYPV